MPFEEDLRDYFFPSLEFVKTLNGQTLTLHPNLPTDEMKHAMEKFIDDMDLEEEKDQYQGEGDEKSE